MANLTLYWYPKCSTCRNAKSWLEDQGHDLELVDLVKETPSQKVLGKLHLLFGGELDDFFNKRGQVFREMNLKEKLPQLSDEEKLRLLAQDGKLIKRPIVSDESQVTLGFKQGEFTINWGK